MNQITFINGLFAVLEETFESSKDAAGSIYLDRKIGVFETLDRLTAAQASHEVNGTSIAAHSEHLRFYVAVLHEYLTGGAPKVNWADSWRVKTVTDDEWTRLKNDLRQTYDAARETMRTLAAWDEDKVAEAVAIVAHTAYHFGAIRQILKAV